jgi:hypothetical protein
MHGVTVILLKDFFILFQLVLYVFGLAKFMSQLSYSVL